MIVNFIVYDNDGIILRTGSCPKDALSAQAGSGELVMIGEAGDESHVITDGVITALPAKPTSYHVISRATKTWVEDLRLKERYLNTEKHSGRNQTISQGYTYNGQIFQIDLNSRTSISGKVLYLQVNTQVDIVYWKATDNSIVAFTREEFFVFASAVSDYYENLILTT
jgi:hypothetical protein